MSNTIEISRSEVESLRADKARLDSVVTNCWLVHQGNENQFAVFEGCTYITPWLPSVASAIDAARAAEGRKP